MTGGALLEVGALDGSLVGPLVGAVVEEMLDQQLVEEEVGWNNSVTLQVSAHFTESATAENSFRIAQNGPFPLHNLLSTSCYGDPYAQGSAIFFSLPPVGISL